MAHVATVVKITDCLKKAGINFLESDSNGGIGVRIKLLRNEANWTFRLTWLQRIWTGAFIAGIGANGSAHARIVTVSSNAG